MIKGIEVKQLTTHPDSRGFFREIIRTSDPFFAGAFGQWSHSMMHQGVIKAWHLHQKQIDWWYVAGGVIRAVVCDVDTKEIQEFVMGDYQPPIVLKIPPGIAHGCKVLQGPAHLLYVTSEEYNPADPDEGRIDYDSLGYDWFSEVIK